MLFKGQNAQIKNTNDTRMGHMHEEIILALIGVITLLASRKIYINVRNTRKNKKR